MEDYLRVVIHEVPVVFSREVTVVLGEDRGTIRRDPSISTPGNDFTMNGPIGPHGQGDLGHLVF